VGVCSAARVMSGPKGGQENIAAASAATVQQAGFALGAAIAGLVANASGLGQWPRSAIRVARVALGSLGVSRGTTGRLYDRRATEPDVPALSPARTTRR
jgi:predicted MFS family arabinose efflux permease